MPILHIHYPYQEWITSTFSTMCILLSWELWIWVLFFFHRKKMEEDLEKLTLSYHHIHWSHLSVWNMTDLLKINSSTTLLYGNYLYAVLPIAMAHRQPIRFTLVLLEMASNTIFINCCLNFNYIYKPQWKTYEYKTPRKN